MTNEYYYANPDFVGYLTSGVSVSEPVPYSRDNEYYLTHNFLMEEDVAGAAFMDARCSCGRAPSRLSSMGTIRRTRPSLVRWTICARRAI